MIDLQSSKSSSKFALKSAGVEGLRYPLEIRDASSGAMQTVSCLFTLGVPVDAQARGTHMSRFVEMLEESSQEPWTLDDLYQFAKDIEPRLNAPGAQVDTSFTWYRKVSAPKSGLTSRLGCEVEFGVKSGSHTGKDSKRVDADPSFKRLKVSTVATALCPCSKAISEYGAHNQRSLISANLILEPSAQTPSIEKIARILEQSASSAVYPILKREDEKHVTEHAYNNPMFAEDLARTVAESLDDLPGCRSFTVRVSNQESIHDHNCFAEIEVVH